MTCRWTGCARAAIPTTEAGVVHAHCFDHERRLTREAWGPVSWHDRARVHELPAMVVGGTPVHPDAPVGGAAPTPQPVGSASLRVAAMATTAARAG